MDTRQAEERASTQGSGDKASQKWENPDKIWMLQTNQWRSFSIITTTSILLKLISTQFVRWSPRLILSLSLKWHFFNSLFFCFCRDDTFAHSFASLPNLIKEKEGVGVILSEVDYFFWFVWNCELAKSWEDKGMFGSRCGISVAPFCVSDRFPPSRIQSMFFFCIFFLLC